MELIQENKLYKVYTLNLLGNHTDRKFAANINHFNKNIGDVHLNVLSPNAKAGNHYHTKVKEYFINAGPGNLILHLRDQDNNKIQKIIMTPASLDEMKSYNVNLRVPHMVENPNSHNVAIITIVDKDNPKDMFSSNIY